MSFTTKGELDEVMHGYQATMGHKRPRKMMYRTKGYKIKKYISRCFLSIRRAWCSCDYRS